MSVAVALEINLSRLVAGLSDEPAADMSALARAGEELDIEWPDDYLAMMSQRDGGVARAEQR